MAVSKADAEALEAKLVEQERLIAALQRELSALKAKVAGAQQSALGLANLLS